MLKFAESCLTIRGVNRNIEYDSNLYVKKPIYDISFGSHWSLIAKRHAADVNLTHR